MLHNIPVHSHSYVKPALSASSAHGAAALPLDARLTSAPALQQEQKAGQFRGKALLQSLVSGYLLRVEHEKQVEELDSEWRKKQREWHLAADSLRVRAAATSR